MRFHHPKSWFGPGQKPGERRIAPRTWEGFALLLLFILACWAATCFASV